MERHITAGRVRLEVTLAAEDGEGLGWLYRHGEVLERASEPDGNARIILRLLPERVPLVTRRFGVRRVKRL